VFLQQKCSKLFFVDGKIYRVGVHLVIYYGAGTVVHIHNTTVANDVS